MKSFFQEMKNKARNKVTQMILSKKERGILIHG